MSAGVRKRCPSYKTGVKDHEDTGCFLVDLGRHHVCVFPVLWPSPAVALVGAMILPVAVQSGLTPLTAAMAMNLFGHGFALSYDAVIQGAPAISAGAADISTTDILSKGWPLFWIMGITCVCSAFLIYRGAMTGQNEKMWINKYE